jgi:hypothetical protein
MISNEVFIKELNDGVLVKCKNIFGKEATMFLPTNTETVRKYLTGEHHVHVLFPSFNADQREFLVTGLMPDEFDMIMPEDK